MKATLRLIPFALILLLSLAVLAPLAVYAADGEGISDIALAYGDGGAQELEGSGYTVMGRPLTADVWLGYKKGGEGSDTAGRAVSAAPAVFISHTIKARAAVSCR